MDENSLRRRFDLQGKVALVTGASKGIGEAIASGLADFGATVVVSSRRQEAVDEVAARIVERGGQAHAIAAHMGDPAQVSALVEAANQQCGGLDIIVNNAATNPVFGPLVNADDAAFAKIMAVNVQGPLALCRQALPGMRQRGGGSMPSWLSMKLDTVLVMPTP